MTKQQLIETLEYLVDSLENPTYNSLEDGFRHTPLSKDEIIQRYDQECRYTRLCISQLLEKIQNEGIA